MFMLLRAYSINNNTTLKKLVGLQLIDLLRLACAPLRMAVLGT